MMHNIHIAYGTEILLYNALGNATSNGTDLDMDCRKLLEQFRSTTDIMDMYVVPLFIIGLPANLLVFIVFSQDELPNCANALLFRLLAVFDATVVFVNIGLQNIASLAWRSVITYSDWTCKISVYMYLISRTMSALTLSILAIERALAVTWPLNLENMDTKRRFLLLTFVLFGAIFVIYFPCCIFVTHAVFVGWYDACSIPGEFSAYTQFLTKAKFLMSTMLPMISMIISDILIIQALRKSRQILHKHNDKSTDHIIPTLLAATIVFLILQLPYVAYNFFQLLPPAKSAPCRDAIIPIIAYVANLCDYINHSINMFLYCMTGRRFRAALKSLFPFGSCKGRTGNT